MLSTNTRKIETALVAIKCSADGQPCVRCFFNAEILFPDLLLLHIPFLFHWAIVLLSDISKLFSASKFTHFFIHALS
jgi:hypothetical protein